jgi:GTPase SAR1 family protein
MLCYDSTNRSSFSDVGGWLRQIENHANPEVVLCLVATKSDIKDYAVSPEEGEQLAQNHNMLFFSTSSKLGTNIREAFTAVAAQVKVKLESDRPQSPAKQRRITIDQT